jgi:diguanylate cyclase (GGDEF)-like protein
MLLSFAVYSAVLLVLVGAGMSAFVRRNATERAEYHVIEQAELLAANLLPAELTERDFAARVDARREAELDEFFARSVLTDEVIKAQLFSASGELIYNTADGPTPDLRAEASTIEEVLEGEPEMEMTYVDHAAGRRDVRAIEGWVPVMLVRGGEPVGALEIYYDYAPVAADIRSIVTPLLVILGAGFALLYAALLPLLIRLSRRLRHESTRNEHQARHDLLTGLANRRKFIEELGPALVAMKETGTSGAVLVMDLDRFKEINDTLGHHQGDAVLREVAARLHQRLRGDDLIARLGGDEFAVLLRHARDVTVVRRIAADIHRVLEKPFVIGEMSLVVDASVGVALAPMHGTDADILIQRADMAMYAAKSSRTGFEIYDEELDRSSTERLTLAGDLRRAVSNDELVVHYQPKASFAGEVVGVEALVRWQHPTLGLVPPDRFIPLAEHSGLIRPLTVTVLRTALDQLRQWDHLGDALTVAVNLSAQHLLDTELPAQIRQMLRDADVDARRLELEITETSLMVNPKRAVAVLRELGEIGVRIAVDDFGTGYSSLQYLKQLPVNVLKIDRSFVGAMTESEHDALIVRSTIDLSRNLGLEVVAEGVETTEIWDALAELGCDVAQGYLLAKPMPAEEFGEWIERPRRQTRSLVTLHR